MSSSDIAISVRGLGKSYTIVHGQQRQPTFRDLVMDRLRNPFKRSAKETFWALKDVSFDIKKGELVGIIGRNGAGKSTLLKILSRITEPTTGEIDLYGRVGSLLEVGTGFHPELTGRENIFLNGAILGMRKSEIRKQFDAIVDFAEVEKFLDTPVKRYSSGMYVRLAFAVAAHLDTEILIVDEVLAVGDANFQKKCIGKMQQVGSFGRTVLFVSHSMPVIQRLCEKAILLDSGSVACFASVSEVVPRYTSSGSDTSCERSWREDAKAPGDSVARLRAVRVLAENGIPSSAAEIRKPVYIEIEYENLIEANSNAAFHLINDSGTTVFASADFNQEEWRGRSRPAGLYRATCEIPGNLLAEGRFTVLAAIVSYNPNVVHALVPDAASFVVSDHSTGDGVRGPAASEWPGLVRPLLNWETTRVEDSYKETLSTAPTFS